MFVVYDLNEARVLLEGLFMLVLICSSETVPRDEKKSKCYGCIDERRIDRNLMQRLEICVRQRKGVDESI